MPTSGWHRARKTKDPVSGLTRFWTHDNGAEIWQGRVLVNSVTTFVYEVRWPDKSFARYRLLRVAKEVGR